MDPKHSIIKGLHCIIAASVFFTSSQLSVLSLPSTDAISMIISPDLDMLVAGCEESCYAWNLKKLSEGSKNM